MPRILNSKSFILVLVLVCLTVVPIIGAAGISSPQRTERYRPKNNVYLVKPADREAVIAGEGLPSELVRSHILGYNQETKQWPEHHLMAKAATQYLGSRTDLDGYQKAVLWEAMAAEISKQHEFLSEYHEGSDGSFVFRGVLWSIIVFTREGKVFRGEKVLQTGEIWQADYWPLTTRNGPTNYPHIAEEVIAHVNAKGIAEAEESDRFKIIERAVVFRNFGEISANEQAEALKALMHYDKTTSHLSSKAPRIISKVSVHKKFLKSDIILFELFVTAAADMKLRFSPEETTAVLNRLDEIVTILCNADSLEFDSLRASAEQTRANLTAGSCSTVFF
jgi:hypothetical protein